MPNLVVTGCLSVRYSSQTKNKLSLSVNHSRGQNPKAYIISGDHTIVIAAKIVRNQTLYIKTEPQQALVAAAAGGDGRWFVPPPPASPRTPLQIVAVPSRSPAPPGLHAFLLRRATFYRHIVQRFLHIKPQSRIRMYQETDACSSTVSVSADRRCSASSTH